MTQSHLLNIIPCEDDKYLKVLVQQALANYSAEVVEADKSKDNKMKDEAIHREAPKMPTTTTITATTTTKTTNNVSPCQKNDRQVLVPGKRKRQRSFVDLTALSDTEDSEEKVLPDPVVSRITSNTTSSALLNKARPVSPTHSEGSSLSSRKTPSKMDIILPEEDDFPNPRYFHDLVRESLPLYAKAPTEAARTRVVQRMMGHVKRRGGRFWVPSGWTTADTVRYMEKWLRLELDCLARLAKQQRAKCPVPPSKQVAVQQESAKIPIKASSSSADNKPVPVTSGSSVPSSTPPPYYPPPHGYHPAYYPPPPPYYAPYSAMTRQPVDPRPTGPLPRLPTAAMTGPYSDLLRKSSVVPPTKAGPSKPSLSFRQAKRARTTSTKV